MPASGDGGTKGTVPFVPPTLVMGIVNVTPDSFADDVHRGVTAAIDYAIELAAQGADIIDVGGESTRPGATRVTAAEELARVVPVVEALAGAGIAVGVDTVRAEVALAAVRAGARLVNDVSGGLADPAILEVVADHPVGYVLQHWRTFADHRSTHVDVVEEVRAELSARAERALAAGLDPARLILDPGVGFGKTAEQNWALVARAADIGALGYPVLWGVSRKRFLTRAYDRATDPWERDAAGTAVTTLLARAGAWGIRTHAVAAARTAVAVAELAREGVGQRGRFFVSHTAGGGTRVGQRGRSCLSHTAGGGGTNSCVPDVPVPDVPVPDLPRTVPDAPPGGGTVPGVPPGGGGTNRTVPGVPPRPATPDDLSRLPALDEISVTGIEVWAHHGVFDHERRDGQPFVVDLTWWLDSTAAGGSDDLADTIDYGAVAEFVRELVGSDPVDLIETVVRRLQEGLLARFPMEFVRVVVHKPSAPLTVPFADVALAGAIVGRWPDKGDGSSCPDAETFGQTAASPLSGSHLEREVVFSLGSNIEPRLDYLQFAVTALATTPGITGVRVSPVYETAPQSDVPHADAPEWDVAEPDVPQSDAPQADYLNAVVLARSALPAPELLRRGLAIEAAAGRTREVRHGPRTLDIDLIRVGDETCDTPDLQLPHPRAAERAFVLVPWLDLDPAARLQGQSIGRMTMFIREQPVTRTIHQLFLP